MQDLGQDISPHDIISLLCEKHYVVILENKRREGKGLNKANALIDWQPARSNKIIPIIS